jgi:hypothetical protein
VYDFLQESQRAGRWSSVYGYWISEVEEGEFLPSSHIVYLLLQQLLQSSPDEPRASASKGECCCKGELKGTPHQEAAHRFRGKRQARWNRRLMMCQTGSDDREKCDRQVLLHPNPH